MADYIFFSEMIQIVFYRPSNIEMMALGKRIPIYFYLYNYSPNNFVYHVN